MSGEGSTIVQLCVLRVGGEDYCIDLKRVEEILPVPAVTSVARAPGFLEGVVKLRGEVLPVVDVRKRLKVAPNQAPALTPSGKPRNRERLLVCRIGMRRVGFIVDAVTSVHKAAKSDLRPAPLAARPGESPFVLGVCGEPGSLKLLLDVRALLAEDAP